MSDGLGVLSKFRTFGFTIALICAFGVGFAQAHTLSPCSSPKTAGFRATTIDLAGAGFNGDLTSVAVGDFNGDGRADAVVANYETLQQSRLYVYLGDATNGLTYSTTISSVIGATGIAVTDFNNDSKLDLVLTNFNTIQTLVGNGTGSFTPVASYSVTSATLAIGDFNVDTKQDIAAAYWYAVPGRVSILMGFGTGTYASPVDTPTGDSPGDLKAADLNGDNKLDLITVNGSNGVSVLLNNGSGSFSFPTHFPTPAGLVNPTLAVGDFNNDLKIDVAVANEPFGGVPYTTPTMAVLLGNGMGGFGTATVFDLGINFRSVSAGDFNGDGKVDIVGLNNIQVGPGAPVDPGTLVLLAGNGMGGFAIADTTGVSYGPRALGVGDFNNDGKLDVITSNSFKSLNTYADVSVLLGNCNSPYKKSDYDGDGKADFAVWRPSDGTWRIRQSSDNTLRIQPWGLGSLGDKPAPGDYDGDGKADLAVFRPSQGTWYILNSSNSTVRATPWGISGDRAVPGDFDGDLKTDVAVFRPGTGIWYVLRSSDQIMFAIGWGINTDKTVQGDYDGDGKTDVAVWRPATGFWYIVNSSNSSFRFASWGTNGDLPVPGDYDGDGMSDLVVYRPSTNRWYLFKPDAPGQYIDMTVGTSADQPAPADYDGDGLTDYAMWRPSNGLFDTIKSFTGGRVTSAAIGTTGDIPVSTPYAPE